MDLVEKTKKHWFFGVVSIAVVCTGFAWIVAWELFVKPREYTLEQNEKKINELKERISELKDKLDSCKNELKKCRDCRDGKSRGRIVLPREGEAVTMEFSFEVEILRSTPECHYYLVNEVGGLYWPKYEINPGPNDGKIIGQIIEAGNPPGGRFHLVLIEVNENGHQKLREWFKGKNHFGIQRIGNILHRIELRIKN